MKTRRSSISRCCALFAATVFAVPAWSLTGVQVGPSGRTYASDGVRCALHPVQGMAPMVQAGLYAPTKKSTATVSLNGAEVATVDFLRPDAVLWLANRADNLVVVALNKRKADGYTFDAASAQVNACIPDTSANTLSGELETAASGKSSATLTPGCAWNPLAGRPQPYVHLFDNGSYLLDVSINNVPLTQLDGITRTHTPVFLSAGLNVIAAANAALSTDRYVRDGGTGTCSLP
jgi:hypothetical protein